MATKTISIDLEAYRRLKAARRPDESFSQALKRLIKPRTDYKEWLKRVRELPPMDDAGVRAVEQQVRNRRTRRRGGS